MTPEEPALVAQDGLEAFAALAAHQLGEAIALMRGAAAVLELQHGTMGSGEQDALRALNADKLVPGRGPALTTPEDVHKGLDYTKDFVTTLLQQGREAVEQKLDLKAAMAHTRDDG